MSQVASYFIFQEAEHILEKIDQLQQEFAKRVSVGINCCGLKKMP